jgi:hypothetical protein|tara:strand:+ start:283 stop:519 length:237 start_codon:yes stop_codon:yes gene_type:complete
MLIDVIEGDGEESKIIDLSDGEQAAEELGDDLITLLLAMQMGGVSVIGDKVFMPIFPNKNEKQNKPESLQVPEQRSGD